MYARWTCLCFIEYCIGKSNCGEKRKETYHVDNPFLTDWFHFFICTTLYSLFFFLHRTQTINDLSKRYGTIVFVLLLLFLDEFFLWWKNAVLQMNSDITVTELLDFCPFTIIAGPLNYTDSNFRTHSRRSFFFFFCPFPGKMERKHLNVNWCSHREYGTTRKYFPTIKKQSFFIAREKPPRWVSCFTHKYSIRTIFPIASF